MKTVVFLVIFVFVWANSKCQSCYKVLAELSGVDISSYQSSLQAKACQLRDSIPVEFRNDFKVLDFGFYSQSEHTTGGFKAVWDNKVVPQANMESKYYILFGKQTDQNGIYTKFWVEVKLPESGIFECFTSQHRLYITTQIKSVTETNYSVNGRLYTTC